MVYDARRVTIILIAANQALYSALIYAAIHNIRQKCLTYLPHGLLSPLFLLWPNWVETLENLSGYGKALLNRAKTTDYTHVVARIMGLNELVQEDCY